MTDLAIGKIKKELKSTSGDKYVAAVKTEVADALITFCKQDAEFAQAVAQSEKTLGDCCKSIMAGCGSKISDLAVYRKAVQFYFPGADIHMTMTIDLCASVSDRQGAVPSGQKDSAPVEKGGGIVLDLTDFL